MATPARTRSDVGSVIGQITRLVAANETLKLRNAELLAITEQLRAQLLEIGSALGRLTRRTGRRGAEPASFAEAKHKRQRRRSPIPRRSSGAGRHLPRRAPCGGEVGGG